MSAESYAAAGATAKDVSSHELRSLVGIGNPLVFDPPAGFPNPSYFNRKLRFRSVIDVTGRIRLSALTIDS